MAKYTLARLGRYPHEVHSATMRKFTPVERKALINAIAAREGTTKQLAQQWGLSVADLRTFVAESQEDLEIAREQYLKMEEQREVSELWISVKNERLRRYQAIAEDLYKEIKEAHLSGSEYATALREFRSYLAAVANELGQLLHRGAGDAGTDSLSVDFQGIDVEGLR